MPGWFLLLLPSPTLPCLPPFVLPASVGSDFVLALPGEHHHRLGGHLLPCWVQGNPLCSQVSPRPCGSRVAKLPRRLPPLCRLPLEGCSWPGGEPPHPPPLPRPASCLLPHPHHQDRGRPGLLHLQPFHRANPPHSRSLNPLDRFDSDRVVQPNSWWLPALPALSASGPAPPGEGSNEAAAGAEPGVAGEREVEGETAV